MTKIQRTGPVAAIVVSAAGGVLDVRAQLAQPLVDHGLAVVVIPTPTAAAWLDHAGERSKLEQLTGYPVRSDVRQPDQPSGHPAPDLYVVAPGSANTVAKLAAGIADNHALTGVSERLCDVPVIVWPRINAAHARHPAWNGHLDALRRAGVQLVYGPDVWPLYEPRQAPADRPMPWDHIVDLTLAHAQPGTA